MCLSAEGFLIKIEFRKVAQNYFYNLDSVLFFLLLENAKFSRKMEKNSPKKNNKSFRVIFYMLTISTYVLLLL